MFERINGVLGTAVPLLIVFGGVFFAIKTRFLLFRRPVAILSSLFGKTENKGISPFRAATVALSGTLGVGNIVGVASAVVYGGCGAVFWMWVSSIFAMILKYAEITLSVAHRRAENGGFFGGAFYYIQDLFDKLGKSRLGAFLSSLFSIFFLLNGATTGCAVQINAAASALHDSFGLPKIAVGLFAALVTAVVVVTGADGVSKFMSKVIPILSVGFILLSLAAILKEPSTVPSVFSKIFADAFNAKSAVAGTVGFISIRALRYGGMRGLLSNEAGCGTAPTAHASADAKSPAEQGFWGIFEVFADTTVLCTLTALVVVANLPENAEGGMLTAARAYSSALGAWAGGFLAAACAVFGIATVVCWAHYGSECVKFLVGSRTKRLAPTVFLVIFSAITVISPFLRENTILALADLALGVMTIINIPTLLIASRDIQKLTLDFFRRPASLNSQRAISRRKNRKSR